MIGRTAGALFWLTLIALAVAGAYLAVFDAPQPPATGFGAQPPGDSRRAPTGGPSREQAAEEPGRERTARRRGPAVAEAREPGPRARDLRRLDRERARAEPVARSFFSAFAHYEVGELDRRVVAQLRATATDRFAGELVGSPPRVRPRSSAPAPAALRRLVFVAGELGAHGELRGAELVGSVERGGRHSPIAIELVRRSRGWRVSGVGR